MKESKLATILALAALDDSAIKSLEQRVNELAELGFKPEIVEELPEEGNDHTLYLVPQNEPGEDPWYKEYLWLDDEWENIGTTSINFENFEQVANKVTSLSNQSTDTQYPSAKAVYDSIALSKLELQTLTVGGNERLTVDLTTLKPGIYLPDKKTYSCSIGNTILDGLVYAVIIVKEYQETVTTDTIFAYVLYTNNGIPTTTVDHDLRLEAYYKRTGEIGFTHKSIVDNCGFVTKWAQTFDGVKTFSSLPISTSTPATDYQLTNKKYVDDTILNNAIQYNTIPTASADNVNKIIQYTGTTTQDYIQGYYYICVSDGELEPTYSWEQINVQPAPNMDNYFFNDVVENWDLLTPEQQVAFAVAVVDDGGGDVPITPEIQNDLNDIIGSEEPIISDMTEEEAIEATNEIIGGGGSI